VHIYSDDDDIVTAGNGFVGIHACSRGLKTLRMPDTCRLEDITTGEDTDRGADFRFHMRKGETKLMRVIR